jgi:predicted amidohydrolase
MSNRADVLRVASIQFRFRAVATFADFSAHVRYWVQVAKDAGAEVVLFPEFFSAELLTLPAHQGKVGRQAFEALAEHTENVQALLAGLSVEYAVTIIGGSQPSLEGENLYNVATVYFPDGSSQHQPKLHITPSEMDSYGIAGGDSLSVVATPKAKIGVLICYDVEFPEAARALAELGAEILFVPYCTDNREGHLRVRYCAHARTIENQMYVVTSGVTGDLVGVHGLDVHFASSAILTPNDREFARDGVLREAETNQEMLVVADLDLGALRANREGGTVRPLADRRLDLFPNVLGERGSHP